MEVRRAQHNELVVSADDAEFGLGFDRWHGSADIFEEDGDVVIRVLLFVQTAWV